MIIKEYFLFWSITVISATFLLVFTLWIINVGHHYEDLKERKAPKPLIVLIKQLGIVRLLLLLLSLLPINSLGLDRLKGRQVWLSWDIRWGPHDSTLAKIEEVLRYPKGYALLIKLERPIEFSTNSIIEKIIFEPNNRLTNLMWYYFGAVSGGLFPSEDVGEFKDLKSNESLASCEIVVY